MKFFAAALIATTAFAQFDPVDCCRTHPPDPRCLGCSLESEAPVNVAAVESNEYIPEPEPTLAEKLFEKNEAG